MRFVTECKPQLLYPAFDVVEGLPAIEYVVLGYEDDVGLGQSVEVLLLFRPGIVLLPLFRKVSLPLARQEGVRVQYRARVTGYDVEREYVAGEFPCSTSSSSGT